MARRAWRGGRGRISRGGAGRRCARTRRGAQRWWKASSLVQAHAPILADRGGEGHRVAARAAGELGGDLEAHVERRALGALVADDDVGQAWLVGEDAAADDLLGAFLACREALQELVRRGDAEVHLRRGA